MTPIKKTENLKSTPSQLTSKKITLFAFLFFIGLTGLKATDFEKGMQKGKEMFSHAQTLQETVDVANYFERIAEANKTEWLPLYYAAYSSLSAGFQQEKTDTKDEWFLKGLALIERAKEIKKNESELFALEGYLKLMYISNQPMQRAQTQTGKAIESLEVAKNLDPSNPRPWLIHGQNTLFTPEFFGGGTSNAKPLLEKASGLYKTFTPVNSLMPEWGKERCEKLLEKCAENEKGSQQGAK